MPERNRTFIWAILLIVLVVGVLLLPTPTGYVGRQIVFNDEFNASTVDTTKWTIDKTPEFFFTIPTGNYLLAQGLNNSLDGKITTKQSFTPQLYHYEAYLRHDSESYEGLISMIIRSRATDMGSNYIKFDIYPTSITGVYENTLNEEVIVDLVNQDMNNQWIKIEFVLDMAANTYTVSVFNELNQVLGTITLDDWHTSSDRIYFEYEFTSMSDYDLMSVDDVTLWIETAGAPSINIWWLIILGIISFILIILGSIVFGNCQHIHLIATMIGFTGLLIICGLLLNVWWILTWSFITTIIGIYCFIALSVYENWEVDSEYYESSQYALMAIGITCFFISMLEYIYLMITNYYPVFWSGWVT